MCVRDTEDGTVIFYTDIKNTTLRVGERNHFVNDSVCKFSLELNRRRLFHVMHL